MDMSREAMRFEEHMEEFFKDIAHQKGKGYAAKPNHRGIVRLSPYSSDLIGLECRCVEDYVRDNLYNRYSLFDDMIFSWVDLYKEKNQESGSIKLYEEEVSETHEACLELYPEMKPNIFLNNLERNINGRYPLREKREANEEHGNDISTFNSLGHGVALSFYYDSQRLLDKLSIDTKDLVEKCTATGVWIPSDERSRDESKKIYLELRSLGYKRYDIWS